MRITANMLVQQLVQAAKSEGAQRPAAGTAITARIAEVLNGALMLDTGGGTLISAKDMSGRTFVQGQTVVFEVIGQDDAGNLQIRPAAGEADAALEQDAIGPLLKKMNMPDTESNRELLRALSSYRIPLNAENVKAAQEMNRQAKGIVQMAEAEGSAVLAKHGAESLKQLAVRLIDIAANQTKGAAGATGSGPKQPDAAALAAPNADMDINESAPKLQIGKSGLSVEGEAVTGKAQQQAAAEKMQVPLIVAGRTNAEAQKLQTTVPASIETEVSSGQENFEEVQTIKLPASIPTNESRRGEELKEVLKQLTFEKIGFVLKNQLPGDMETFNALDKLIMGKKDLGVQLRELLSNLPADEAASPLREAIRNAVKAVHISPDMNPFELQKQLKSLSQTLSSISAHASEALLSQQRVQESLADVKSSLDFLSRLSESSTYLHVPVNLGQGTKPMDLYVQRDKSGQKKVNPKDTRIFISLDTNHMETVQCLVEVQDKRLNIGFKLANQEALAAISPYFEPLKESLAAMDYKDVMIQAVIYRRPLNLMDITQESSMDSRQIDMRI